MVKKILIGLGCAIALAVIGVGIGASLQPDSTHVERSVLVNAVPADVFPYANNFDLWVKWSPFQDLDPKQVITQSPVHEGKDAWFEWNGDSDVGQGRMTITESTPPSRVVEQLHFMKPMESMSTATLTFEPVGDQTKVTWAFDQKNDFVGKLASLFVDMDGMLGTSFQSGLDKMKPLAEASASKRIADEKASADSVANGLAGLDAALAGIKPVEGAQVEPKGAPGSPSGGPTTRPNLASGAK